MSDANGYADWERGCAASPERSVVEYVHKDGLVDLYERKFTAEEQERLRLMHEQLRACEDELERRLAEALPEANRKRIRELKATINRLWREHREMVLLPLDAWQDFGS